MFSILAERVRQKNRTVAYPAGEPVLPDRFRGLPRIDATKCRAACTTSCAAVCPTGAIQVNKGRLAIDLGRCIFCGACADACEDGVISFSREFRLAARTRKELIHTGREGTLVRALDLKMRRLLGRSLKLRQVSAGGCNACEADTNVLATVVFDLGRFGIQFVASPRHADGLLITGPVTRNMRLALEKTYAAVPEPKIVIAAGACAIAGGPYIGHPEACDGADSVVPVDLYIPGCPPHPLTILDGMLRLLGRIEAKRV
ncbi:NADH-quinone oxidoreductase subunit NuoB [bacterium]|nr:NADH-quinone oxidoreductase subunit NuoB [bacterium]